MMNDNEQPRLTLEDLKSALQVPQEAQEHAFGNIEVLYELASNKKALAEKIAGNTELLKKFGDEAEILRELDVLEQKYEDQIQTIEAGKKFGEKIEKQSWGRWALEKVKSVVKFPIRHPIVFLLILVAVLACFSGYMGWLPGFGSTLSGWAQKAKALLGLEATSAAESVGALEAATEAANVPNVVLNIVEKDVFYNGAKYGMNELPTLLEKLPTLQPNQMFQILRHTSARPSVEGALQKLLVEKFGEGSWVMPSELLQ